MTPVMLKKKWFQFYVGILTLAPKYLAQQGHYRFTPIKTDLTWTT
jgi:hypothetical protein